MKVFYTLICSLLLASCVTVNFDDETKKAARSKETAETTSPEGKKPEKETKTPEQELAYVEEEMKQVDVEQSVIYVDHPVYSPDQKAEEGPPPPKGPAAVQQAAATSLQIPMKHSGGMMLYPWDDTFTYEIHCQPYRATDLMLEPGETVLEMPFLSEEKVWEISAGVSRKNNQDVQHFFLKPSAANLTTSMIIITSRRVYHLLLKSFTDRFMVMVSWEYPPAPRMNLSTKTDASAQDGKAPSQLSAMNSLDIQGLMVNPEFLSFDYTMTYNVFKKPRWLPRRVYDDGRKTYIQLDEAILNMETPVLFNNKNERVNYRANKNILIIDGLIEKVTLRSGSEKVTIEKKDYLPKGAYYD